MRGRIQAVRDVMLGSELESDTASGATSIVVADLADFDWENGGSLTIGGVAVDSSAYTVDSEAYTLELAVPTANDHVAGDPVLVYPTTLTRWATIASDLQEEEISARVPHALMDKVPTGIRDITGDDTSEVVEYDYTSDGDVIILDIIGQTPIVDGSYLDPETVPPPPASDGDPPAVSPDVVVQGGIGFIVAKWTPISNSDPVEYEVHVSTSSGFTPSSDTLAGTTMGSMYVIRTLPPNDDALDSTVDDMGLPSTTYYVQVVAKDVDGSAAPGAEHSGSPVLVTSDDIAANSVLAAHILAGEVTAEKLESTLLLSTIIATASEGQRVEISPEGIRLIGPDENDLINLPTDGDAIFNGLINAYALDVDGPMLLRSSLNQIDVGGKLKLGSAQGNPTVAPSVSVTWDSLQLDNPFNVQGQGFAYASNGGDDFLTPSYYALSRTQTGYVFLEEFDASTGDLTRTAIPVQGEPLGVTKMVVGSNHRIFILVRTQTTSFHFNVHELRQSDLALVNSWSVDSQMPGSFIVTNPNITACLGNDGTNLLVACHENEATGDLSIHKYDPADGTYNGVTSTSGADVAFGGGFKLTGVIVQSTIYYISTSTSAVYPFSSTGVYDEDKVFVAGNFGQGGIAYHDSAFRTYQTGAHRVYTHSDWTWDSSDETNFWFAYSWADATHETLPSPRTHVNIGFWRRAKLRITPPGRPAGITANRIYALPSASAPAVTALRRQTATAYIDSETAAASIMKNYDAAGTVHGGASTFGDAGSPATIEPAGGDGLAYTAGWKLAGSGEMKLPVGTTTQRDAGPANNGDMLYNSTDGEPQMRVGGSWRSLYHAGNYPFAQSLGINDSSANVSLGTTDTAITGASAALSADAFYLLLAMVDVSFDTAAAGFAEFSLTTGGPPGTRIGIPTTVGRLAGRGGTTIVHWIWTLSGAVTARLVGKKSGSGWSADVATGRARLLYLRFL